MTSRDHAANVYNQISCILAEPLQKSVVGKARQKKFTTNDQSVCPVQKSILSVDSNNNSLVSVGTLIFGSGMSSTSAQP